MFVKFVFTSPSNPCIPPTATFQLKLISMFHPQVKQLVVFFCDFLAQVLAGIWLGHGECRWFGRLQNGTRIIRCSLKFPSFRLKRSHKIESSKDPFKTRICAIGSINSHYLHVIGDKLINPIVGVYIPIWWWQLKYFWNFHPYLLGGNDPIWRSAYFKNGWRKTTN